MSYRLTLSETVDEVVNTLYGLSTRFEPDTDSWHGMALTLRRALKVVATERDWIYYHDTVQVGTVEPDCSVIVVPSRYRVRKTGDDAIRLLDSRGRPVVWAYIIPDDALHKYRALSGLWCSVVRQEIRFSRPFYKAEKGLRVIAPVMREPYLWPKLVSGQALPQDEMDRDIDFHRADMVVMKAAYLYAQTDPLLQPRVPQLEQDYRAVFYQVQEQDTNVTMGAMVNDFQLPIEGDYRFVSGHGYGLHPHSDGSYG